MPQLRTFKSQEPFDISASFSTFSVALDAACFGLARPQIGAIRSVWSRFLVPISGSALSPNQRSHSSVLRGPFFADFHQNGGGIRRNRERRIN